MTFENGTVVYISFPDEINIIGVVVAQPGNGENPAAYFVLCLHDENLHPGWLTPGRLREVKVPLDQVEQVFVLRVLKLARKEIDMLCKRIADAKKALL